MPANRLRRLLITGAAVSALVLTGCTSEGERPSTSGPTSSAEQTTDTGAILAMPEFDISREQQLLAGTWNYMPGAEQSGATLKVHNTGLAILRKPDVCHDPSEREYLPNPPVNVYGTHVEMQNGSDFGVAARLSALDGAATMSFHSKPPVRFDECLKRSAGLDVSVDGRAATVTAYDASGAESSMQQFELADESVQADVSLAQIGDQVVVSVNGTKIGVNSRLFENQVWFGADAEGAFTIDELNAYPVGNTEITQVDIAKTQYAGGQRSPDGLAALVAAGGHNVPVGTAVDTNSLFTNPQYAEFVVQNFSSIETEMLAKFQALQPERGHYEFAELDALVDFANRHGIEVHGHTLVFGEANPQWLHDALAGASPAEARELLRDHITTVVSRYNGQNGHGEIRCWDLVNEPFDPDDWEQLNQNNIWYKALGPEYIVDAFRFAREANPSGCFGINEWGMETDDDRWAGMLRQVQALTAAGQKPDFVGFQAHFDEGTLADDDAMGKVFEGQVARRFEELNSLGINVHVSELSVAENRNPQLQARVYETILRNCLEAANCQRFNLWGATSAPFYFTSGDWGVGDDAPTITDETGAIVPRQAWEAMKQAAR